MDRKNNKWSEINGIRKSSVFGDSFSNLTTVFDTWKFVLFIYRRLNRCCYMPRDIHSSALSPLVSFMVPSWYGTARRYDGTTSTTPHWPHSRATTFEYCVDRKCLLRSAIGFLVRMRKRKLLGENIIGLIVSKLNR